MKSGRNIFLFVTMFLPLKVMAVPSAYTNSCGSLNIENTTNSTILRDNENCQTLWVLPPTSGISKVSGFTPNANLGICRAYKEDDETNNYLAKSMRLLAGRIEQMEADSAKIQDDIFEISSKIIDYENLPAVKEIKSLTVKEEDLSDEIDSLVEKSLSCEVNCDEIREEVRDKKTERKNLRDDLRELKRNHRDLSDKYEELKSLKKALEERLVAVYERFDKAKNARIELRALVQGFLKQYIKIEGGYAHLDYNTGWEENISKLQQKYSGEYDFKAIPTRNARVFANFVGSKEDKESYMGSSPLILDYTFAGLKYIPWGEERTAEMSALPSHLSGAVRMNLIGACPLYYDNFTTSRTGDDLVVSQDFKKSTMSPSVVVNYEYPSAFKFNVTAKYNLFKFYEKIVTSSSKGGFFRKKTQQDVTENNIDKDSFEIIWNDEDGLYSKEEKNEIAKNLKDELMDRVLQNMAIPIFEKPVNVSTPELGMYTNGAVVLARGFQNTCGWNIYCRASSWVLIGLDSIFGGSKAVSCYRATNDRWAMEKWSTNETKWRPSSTGFYSL